MIAPDGTAFTWHGAATDPVVVLIHGLGLNQDMWAPQLPALSGFRMLTYDMIGHGDSPAPSARVDLRDLSDQLVRLLDHCGVQAAAIIGFSMGGMVARRFAQDHAHRVLALGILNSGHRRSDKAQANIISRVEQARDHGPAATVELALERWFTPAFHAASPQTIDRVRQWVLANDPAEYHKLYRVLAEDLDQIIAPEPPICAPTLVMTSSGDYGQSPEMATQIAAEIDGAECVIIPDLNHMAPTENPDAYNKPLADFLTRALAPPDARALRAAFGTFATGVTVVTTRQPDGTPRGFTANSFTSVSLDPPLVLVCLAKSAHSMDVFSTAPHFAINILSDQQKAVSGLFASRAPDKFEQADWDEGLALQPIIPDALAQFTCARHEVVDAGDHIILIGRVIGFETRPGQPLGYFRGHYFDIGLEETLVNAAAEASLARIGAILQMNGHVLMRKAADGLCLPTARSQAALHDKLEALGLHSEIDFLYAVYQDGAAAQHSIFYHGQVQGGLPEGFLLVPLGDLASAGIASAAEKSMLTRYANEYLHGEYGIYQGDEARGQVRRLAQKTEP